MTDLAVKWVRRHTLNVRISHWINLIAVGYLLVSGVHIFLDFPELYWGKTGFRGYPAAFRLEDLGISWDQAAKWGNRRWGRNYHYTFGWVFVINGLVYVGWSLYRRHFRRSMLHGQTSPDTAESSSAASVSVPSQAESPSPRYGTPQRFAYLGMIFVVTPLLFLTGIAQMPAFTAIAPWLIDMFGGRQTARTIHTITTVGVVLFVLMHVGQVIAAGPIKKVRGMVTGRVPIMAE
ncbi:MAG: cytochrome b/b6 domain-containing protein [Gemmatimonadaceae bacterium]